MSDPKRALDPIASLVDALDGGYFPTLPWAIRMASGVEDPMVRAWAASVYPDAMLRVLRPCGVRCELGICLCSACEPPRPESGTAKDDDTILQELEDQALREWFDQPDDRPCMLASRRAVRC